MKVNGKRYKVEVTKKVDDDGSYFYSALVVDFQECAIEGEGKTKFQAKRNAKKNLQFYLDYMY